MYGSFSLGLYEGEWSALRTDRFISEELAPVTHELVCTLWSKEKFCIGRKRNHEFYLV